MRLAPAALLLTACAAPVDRTALVLDAPEARTLVVFQAIEGTTATAPLVLDTTDLAALPTTTQEGGVAVDTWIVAYPQPPAELGLAVGPLPPAAASAPSRPLPRPLQAFGAHFSGSALAELALEPLPAAPEAVATFRYAAPCPAAIAADAPLDVITGCPLPFPPRPTTCYGPSAPLPGLDAEGDDNVGSAVREGGQTWLYLGSSRFGQDSFSRHGRVRMIDARTPDLASIAELPTLPPLEKAGDQWVVRGWTAAPWVRADGLEMMFTASYPNQDWQDEDAYVSARTAVDAPWTLGLNTIAMGSALLDRDGVSTPVVLADRRTAVWRTAEGLMHGWRASPAAGGRDFVLLGAVRTTTGLALPEAHGVTVSCDGGHLLYLERGQPWIARIVALPSSFDDRPVGALIVEPRRMHELADPGFGINSFSEHPACEALYLSDLATPFVAPRIECP